MLYRLFVGDGLVSSCLCSLVVEIRWSTLVATLATDFEENCKESLVRFSSGAAYQRLHWDHQKGQKHFTIFAWGDQDEMSKFRNSGHVLLWHEKYSRSMFATKFKIVTSRSFGGSAWLVWGIAMWDVFPNLLQLNLTYCTQVENSDLCSITKLKKLEHFKFQLLLLSWWRRHWTYRPKS